MALDALFLQAAADEIRPQILDARIEKVQQPARDQVILLLRGNRRLLLCAGTEAPRMQFTEVPRENPASPPMFCMLLRKHLSGGRITALEQPPLERLLRLELDAADEFGRNSRRTLVLEAMGRRANLILLDGDGRILDCLRRVDAEMSPDRQLLPGLFYVPPSAPDRMPLTEETEDGFTERLSRAPTETALDRYLMGTYFGLSPLLAREVVFRASGATDTRLCELDDGGRRRFCGAFLSLAEAVRERRFAPYCLCLDGRPAALTALPVTQYGAAGELRRSDSFSRLMDSYFAEREQRERSRVRGAALLRTVNTARDRLKRKLALQERDYAATQNRDALRLQGDLITANLYRMERGARSLECENFYSETGETVTVPLDPLLTPQQNAAKYYKRYTKAKTAETVLAEQMEIARRDLDYLDSVAEELARGETEQDFLDIRRELTDSGFLREPRGKGAGGRGKGAGNRGKKERRGQSRPREILLSSGHQLLVGRNNRQNDALVKGADHRDLWFHTQKIHGSHAVLRTGGAAPEETVIAEAAAAAAYYSQAREGHNVPVDYTPIRYVKKPAGARPGMVIYTTYRTVYVNPGLPGTGKG